MTAIPRKECSAENFDDEFKENQKSPYSFELFSRTLQSKISTNDSSLSRKKRKFSPCMPKPEKTVFSIFHREIRQIVGYGSCPAAVHVVSFQLPIVLYCLKINTFRINRAKWISLRVFHQEIQLKGEKWGCAARKQRKSGIFFLNFFRGFGCRGKK